MESWLRGGGKACLGGVNGGVFTRMWTKMGAFDGGCSFGEVDLVATTARSDRWLEMRSLQEYHCIDSEP